MLGMHELVFSHICRITKQPIIIKEITAIKHTYNACTQEFTLENQSQLAQEYQWDFGNGDSSTEKSPVYKYDDFGTYDITLITNPGSFCADSITKTIDINDLAIDQLFWGNIITPNGDGFKIVIKEADNDIVSSDLLTSITALNRSVESCVRDIPEQYQWEYKRFKRGRPGEAHHYDKGRVW